VAGATGAWYAFDVTEYLRQQKAAGATAVSFALKAQTISEGWAGFNTDEAAADRPALAVTYSAPAVLTQDTYVRGGTHAGNSYGMEPGLMVKESITDDNDRQVYLRFDVSQFSSVGSATLRLFGYVADGATSGQVSAYGATDSAWTETGLTWNNRPATGASPLSTTTVDAAGIANKAWFEWDVTSHVQAARSAGASFVTLVLKSAAQDEVRFVFDSAEAGGKQPQLLIA
jgi:hypothetical protein